MADKVDKYEEPVVEVSAGEASKVEGSEKRSGKKKQPPKDPNQSLIDIMREAEKAGYGRSYGQYVADMKL